VKQNQDLPDQHSWDQFWSKDYQKTKAERSWAKRRIEALLLSGHIPDGIMLDAGCGSGYFSKMFCDWGRETVALDYSSEALHVAAQLTQNKARTMQADLLHDNFSQNFPEKNIAAIFSDGLFEHFEPQDQDRILKNFYTILQGNGTVVTVVPNRWSPWQLIRPFFMPGIKECPFVLSDLKAMHERNGFRIVASGGLNVLPFWLSPEILGPYVGMLLYVIARKKL